VNDSLGWWPRTQIIYVDEEFRTCFSNANTCTSIIIHPFGRSHKHINMFFVLQNFREFSDNNWSEKIGVGDQIQPKFEQKNLLIKVNFETIVDTLPKCRGARAVAFDHHRDWSASGQADLKFCVVSTRFTEETLPFCSQGFPSNSTTVTCGDLKAPKKCQVSSSFLRVELMVIHGEFSRHVGTNPRFK